MLTVMHCYALQISKQVYYQNTETQIRYLKVTCIHYPIRYMSGIKEMLKKQV